MLRVLYAAPTRRASQSYVRHHLGVARSVVSRMMRALERLGFVERDRHDDDRRTRLCKLTASGCKLVASVWSELVHSRVVAGAIDAIWRDPHETRKVALPIFEALTLSFGRWGPVVAP